MRAHHLNSAILPAPRATYSLAVSPARCLRSTLARVALLLALAVAGLLRGGAQAAEVTPQAFRQAVFFGVLEELYQHDLPDDLVDRILRRDPASQLPISFVQGCPVCQPTYDAFVAYRKREPLWNPLGPARALGGQPLPAPLLADLASEDNAVRTRAVGLLVRGAVERKVAALRLSPEEKQAWDVAFTEARRVGEEQLRVLQGRGFKVYQMFWSCMVCDAASKGCKATPSQGR